MAGLTKELMALIKQATKYENQTLSYTPSYPLDKFLWLKSEKLDAFIQKLSDEINNTNLKRRKRDIDAEEKFVFAIKILVLNLLLLSKLPVKTFLAIPKSAGKYTFKTRYDQKHLSYRTFTAVYKGLLALHYVAVEKAGFWNKEERWGEVTRIDATHKLSSIFRKLFPDDLIIFARCPEEESIKQRDENKKWIDYEDTEFSNQARENLKCINNCLGNYWYDLDLSNEELNTLHSRMVKKRENEPKKPPVVNFNSRNLYRVFNNGNKNKPEANFKQGGRFYGGWWEAILSEYRKYITINGKHTVEIDYSNLHPHMLYALVGQKLENDAYEIKGLDRDIGKRAFLYLINKDGKDNRPPKDFDPTETDMTWEEIISIFEKHHQVISSYFRTGYGVELQFKDSEILERILLYFSKKDIPCLPIHDSIIVHHSHGDELREVMLREYQRVFGLDINFKEDDNFKLFTERHIAKGLEAIDGSSIDTILLDTQESEVERRWTIWTKHRYGE